MLLGCVLRVDHDFTLETFHLPFDGAEVELDKVNDLLETGSIEFLVYLNRVL